MLFFVLAGIITFISSGDTLSIAPKTLKSFMFDRYSFCDLIGGKMKLRSKDIAIAGLFVAIVAVMTFVPMLGMIPLVFLSVNIVLVPILVCAQTTNPVVSVIVSTFFGIFSMIRAYVNPAGAGVLYFAVQNPLVSVLPRALIGLVAHYSYKGMKKLFSKKEEEAGVRGFGKRLKKNSVPSVVSAVLGTATNTLLFLGMLVVIYNGDVLSTGTAIGLPWAMGIVATNFLPEVIVAAIMVPLIVTAVEKAVR